MDEYFQVSSNNIVSGRPQNPIPGHVAFNNKTNKIEIFTDSGWIELTNQGAKPELLNEILLMIEKAEANDLKKLLNNFDFIKVVLEQSYLCKC